MKPVYLVDGVRTPIGSFGGSLAHVRADDLAAHVIAKLLDRHPGLDRERISDVMLGCANQAGEDNRNVARMALLLAGLPEHVPGVTVNRLCASGLEAAVQAARAIRLGDMELCIAGGVESMTRAPWALMKPGEGFSSGSLQSYDTALGWRFPNPRMAQRFPLESMGETAENVAAKYRIAREKQDEFALRSHQRALSAREAGRYRAELLPVTVPGKQPATIDLDEGPRADTSLEKLAKLKPAFREGGSVTAGNSSGLNDGAAAILFASARKAAELGLAPLARIVRRRFRRARHADPPGALRGSRREATPERRERQRGAGVLLPHRADASANQALQILRLHRVPGEESDHPCRTLRVHQRLQVDLVLAPRHPPNSDPAGSPRQRSVRPTRRSPTRPARRPRRAWRGRTCRRAPSARARDARECGLRSCRADVPRRWRRRRR